MLERIEVYLQKNVTPEKLDHTKKVAQYAAHLAKQHGADEKQAYLAGMLHDCTKCWGKAKQVAYLKKAGYTITAEDRRAPQIYHQISGAIFAKEFFRVNDTKVIDAIRCHTTGREKMTTLDKILFLADCAEPNRSYEGVDEIRAAAEESLDKAVLMSLNRSITYVVHRGFHLHLQTVKARNWLIKNIYLEEQHGRKQTTAANHRTHAGQ